MRVIGLPVVTVASGGLPVVDVSAVAPKAGTPVTEVASGIGVRVTKVAAYGLPVVYETIGVVAPVVQATWFPASASAATLSGSNLVVTATANSNSGVRTDPAKALSTGKYYFEIALTAQLGGGSTGPGIATTASTYAGLGSNATSGVIIFPGSTGNLWSNGSAAGPSLGVRANGDVLGMAVDLVARKMWMRVAPAGLWNGIGGNDPATGVGGVTIPAGAMAPVCTFNVINTVYTANFGATAFSGAVPSGFTAGWPA